MTLFFIQKTKMIFSGLIYQKKHRWQKVRFFDKNRGPTLLENFEFLDFSLSFSFWSKKDFFLQNNKKTIFSGLICPKDKDDKKFDFLTKTMDQPSWKISNFWTFLSFSFWSKKDFFLQNNKKTIFSGLICPKDKDDKKFDFLTKTVDQPSWKISNFWTFL